MIVCLDTLITDVRRVDDDLHASSFFVPSRAEREAALQPFVDALLRAGPVRAREALRGAHAGRSESLVVAMYKEQRPDKDPA